MQPGRRPAHRRLVLAFAGVLCLLGALPVQAQLGPNRDGDVRTGGDTGGPFLSFVNPVMDGAPRTRPPELHVAFGRRHVRVTMDTGSTGLVLSARDIPHWRRLRSLGPARLTYSSSGRVMEGRWVETPVVIAGGNGRRVRTEPMPVMAVTRIACLDEARDCRPAMHPRGVAMLGIGYAREGDHQAQSTPDHNPFLRLQEQASGRLRRGYVVTRDGVSAGLTRNMPDPAFVTVQLGRDGRTGDWSAPPVCLSIDDRSPPSCGTVLVDTGVTRSFLTAGAQQLDGVVTGTLVRPGTQIGVQLRRENDPPWGYTFRVGDRSDPLVPDEITVVRKDGPAFLNTSVHALNGFDVLYDAEQGQAGYRARR